MYDFGHFVYLEMQKSGSTYVCHFLRECSLAKEKKHNKHDVIRGDYNPKKFYFTTIRHPSYLYSSLYRFGLDGRGGFFKRLKAANKLHLYSSIELFVDFLCNPKNAPYLGEGYSEAIAEQLGFMSFRFMKISLQFPLEKMDAKLKMDGDLMDLESSFITNLEIKNEELNEGLKKIAFEIFPQLFDLDKASLFLTKNSKINASTSAHDPRLQQSLEKLTARIGSKEALLLSRYDGTVAPHIL